MAATAAGCRCGFTSGRKVMTVVELAAKLAALIAAGAGDLVVALQAEEDGQELADVTIERDVFGNRAVYLS